MARVSLQLLNRTVEQVGGPVWRGQVGPSGRCYATAGWSVDRAESDLRPLAAGGGARGPEVGGGPG